MEPSVRDDDSQSSLSTDVMPASPSSRAAPAPTPSRLGDTPTRDALARRPLERSTWFRAWSWLVTKLLLGAAAGFLVVGGVILSRFADEALPNDYLVRPILVAAALSLAVGAVTAWTEHPAALAAPLALVPFAPIVGLALLLVAVVAAAASYARWWQRPLDRLALTVAAIFFGLSLLRAGPLIAAGITPTAYEPARDPPIYVVLLDSYPRYDSLLKIGIDDLGFIRELRRLGFNYYGSARSVHTYTHLTLQAMLTVQRGIPQTPGDAAYERRVRATLEMPPSFAVVAPPIGHVQMPGARRLDDGGINDFEAALLADSVLGVIAPNRTREWIVGQLSARTREAIEILRTTEERRVFVHLMAPHPPFGAGPECWPECQLFETLTDKLGITVDDWAAGMHINLVALQQQLLPALGDIVEREPDAVIVLFSDHGGRYGWGDPDEWHRTFLAARTPGHPWLFQGDAYAHVVLKRVLSVYDR